MLEEGARNVPGAAMPKLPPRRKKSTGTPGTVPPADAPQTQVSQVSTASVQDVLEDPSALSTDSQPISSNAAETPSAGNSIATESAAPAAAASAASGPKLPPRRASKNSQAAKSAGAAKPSSDAKPAPEANGNHPPPSNEKPSSTGRTSPPSGSSALARVPPKEEPRVQELRRKVHALRVLMMRAAFRLGWEDHYVHQVMYRLQFAENLQLPKHRLAGPRPDLSKVAIKEAQEAEADQGPDSKLDLQMTILLVGLEGSGKTTLAHKILAPGLEELPPQPKPTTKVGELHGRVAGVAVRIIDTAGLSLDARKVHQNMMRLKQIRRAYDKSKPDTIIFVDRLDRKQGGDEEQAVLHSLTKSLGGPAFWCNTIVAFTHAGVLSSSNGSAASPRSNGGTAEARAPTWQIQTKQKEVGLQTLIRNVSGDPRLMNPVLWIESGPCPKNANGQPVVFGHHPWRQHVYLMLLSAKILAECEALFGPQMNMPKRNAAARVSHSAPPLSYLLTSLTTINEPIRYPERATVELRKLKHRIQHAPTPWSRKKARLEYANAARQLKMQERYQQSVMRSKVDRVVFAPGPRSTTDPKMPQRYAAVMASDKEGFLLSRTVARPQIDNRLVMDHCDGIVGVQLEHGTVLRSKEWVTKSIPEDGMPTLVTCAAQAGKDRMLVQARCESAVYHDWLEKNVTGLTMDVQTNGSVSNMDTLYNVQIDKHIRGIPTGSSMLTAGAFVSRYAPNGLPHRGPASMGLRLQSRMPTRLLVQGCPLLLSWCLGRMFCRSEGVSTPGGYGVTTELKFDAPEGSRSGPPLTLSASALRHQGETTAGGQVNWQTKIGRHKYGGMAQVMGSKGRLKLRARMNNSYWLVAVGLLPLMVSFYDWGRRRWRAWKAGGALPEGQKTSGTAPQGTQQQRLPR